MAFRSVLDKWLGNRRAEVSHAPGRSGTCSPPRRRLSSPASAGGSQQSPAQSPGRLARLVAAVPKRRAASRQPAASRRNSTEHSPEPALLQLTRISNEGWGVVFRGLAIHSVVAGSPAERCGAGTYLGWTAMRVNGLPVLAQGDISAAVAKAATRLALLLAPPPSPPRRPAAAAEQRQFEGRIIAAAAQAAAELLSGGDVDAATMCIRKSAPHGARRRDPGELSPLPGGSPVPDELFPPPFGDFDGRGVGAAPSPPGPSPREAAPDPAEDGSSQRRTPPRAAPCTPPPAAPREGSRRLSAAAGVSPKGARSLVSFADEAEAACRSRAAPKDSVVAPGEALRPAVSFAEEDAGTGSGRGRSSRRGAEGEEGRMGGSTSFSPSRALRKLSSVMRPRPRGEDSPAHSPPAGRAAADMLIAEVEESEDDESASNADPGRAEAFEREMRAEELCLGESREQGLRSMVWNGAPPEYRAECWRLLSGYAPCRRCDRAAALARKRQEYCALVERYWHTGEGDDPSPRETDQQTKMRRQVTVDVPRMQPRVGLFRLHRVQQALRRLLYIWGVRHPASGYVQGMDGLAAPFFAVFGADAGGVPLGQLLRAEESEAEQMLAGVDDEAFGAAEADSYWCLSSMLDHVQDNYTDGQPGVQRSAQAVEGIVQRVDPELHQFIIDSGCDFLRDICWRWTTCLLARELPLLLVTRLWDTYLAEAETYPSLHIYMCVVFLLHWRRQLMERDFTELMFFLRRLDSQPTQTRQLNMWISQAYMYQRRFAAQVTS